MSATHPLHISDDDVRFFDEQGYFIYHHPLFPQDKFAAIQSYFEELLADLPQGVRTEAMDVPHFAYPKLFDWLLADEVLDLVERFIGPDIALWSSHFISKPPAHGQIVPWHEDSAYWRGRLDPMEVCTVWLAVDDSTAENGCMRVIPGTHSNGYSNYVAVDDASKSVFGTRITEDQFDLSTAVDLELKSGECHLHHAKTIHGSNANESGKRRCGYTMRYMPTTVKYVPNERWTHGIYLARGKDRAGNEYAEPGKRYEPGIRAIYQR